MSQAIVEKEICNACGADVRPQADYCYNCGASISVAAALPRTRSAAVDRLENRDSVREEFGEWNAVVKDLAEEEGVEQKPVEPQRIVERETMEKTFEPQAEEKIIAAETVEAKETSEAETPKIEQKPDVSQERTDLKSAAALRRKSKTLERKTVEVVWEEHDNAPNVWFISAAVFLTLAATVILILALYLK